MCLWSFGMLVGCWLLLDDVAHRLQLGHTGFRPWRKLAEASSLGSWVPRERMQTSPSVWAQKMHNVIPLLSIGRSES